MAKRTDSRSEHFVIAQLSDIHCGDLRFDGGLVTRAVREIQALQPDLIVVAGDLTANGYRDEFEQARDYLAMFGAVAPMIVIPGNHDSRNVGWVHFERLFGPREHAEAYPFVLGERQGENRVKVIAVDSSRPDVDHGNVSAGLYRWIADEFDGDYAFRVFVLHHHLVSVPGTGRERSVVLDGGDVLWNIGRAHVDLTLSGHKHVPWVWSVRNTFLVTSGTAGTRRLRGDTPPSYNVIRIKPAELEVAFHDLDGGATFVQHFERAHRYRRVSETSWNPAAGDETP